MFYIWMLIRTISRGGWSKGEIARRLIGGLHPSEVELHIWQGMAHVFPANLALLEAAHEALDIAGEFLRRNLAR